MLQNLWGRPPGLRGTPRSPPVESRPCTRRWPTRASAADEGVRPTIYADVRLWENYVALPLRSRLSLAARVLKAQASQSGRLADHLRHGGGKLVHLCLRAHRDAHLSRPCPPHASDDY